MKNYDEAYSIILNLIKQIPKKSVEIDLMDSLDHILAEDIISDINLPPFDNSAMDGYAVKFRRELKEWKIIGEIHAGHFSDINIDYDSTVEIMTGAKLPDGADTIIPIEDIEAVGNKLTLKPGIELDFGQHVRKAGENLLIGSLAVQKNVKLKPKEIAVAASLGYSKIKVYVSLKIGILTTGDELVDIDVIPSFDKIRASNLYGLIAQVKNIKMVPVSFGFIIDDKETIKSSLLEALNSDIDILLTSGGVSVGKYDYLKPVLEEIGAEIIFWKANIKPGKPILVTSYKSKDKKTKFIFSLPGNPVSTFVNFKIFIEAAILEYFGLEPFTIVSAFSMSKFEKHDKKRHFLRASLFHDSNKGFYTATKSGSQSSGNLAGLNFSDCLIIFEEDKEVIKVGERVKCIKI